MPSPRDIYVLFSPDWSQAEELLHEQLAEAMKAIAAHPACSRMLLYFDCAGIAAEDAHLLVSGTAMQLLLDADSEVGDLELDLAADPQDVGERLHACIGSSQPPQPLTCNLANFRKIPTEKFFLDLGDRLFECGQWLAASEQYQTFLDLQTGEIDLYHRLAQCYRHLEERQAIFATLEKGIQAHPGEASLHFALIVDLQRAGQIEKALATAERASNSFPQDYTFTLFKHLLLPAIYHRPEEILPNRQRFSQGLQQLIASTRLETETEKQSALAGISRVTNFYLAYQAQNDVELQRQYGELVYRIVGANYPQWVEPLDMPPLTPNGKIRVGYASAYLHSYSGTLWLTGWLKYCDRNHFEIYCYYTGDTPDAVTEQFQDNSDVFHCIPHNFAAAAEQIRRDRLHILVFPEIGMNAATLPLAGLRLAPVQCTAWGHPVTTGLPTLDYFLSSELMEPENARAHYSEKLVRLPNIGVAYPKPVIPPLRATRADFDLPEDTILYLCCQAPFKYLPQYDRLLAEIARRLPTARFLFLRGRILQPRLDRAFSAAGLNYEDYCLFRQIPDRLGYLAINLLSDIYLDTLTWSGGNTSLEAIACHLPIVTCPGEFMRGRHTDSFLKRIDITETIAATEEEYVDIAVKLGLDPAWRSQIKSRMKENCDRLYDDTACVAGLETFYRQAIQQTQI